VLVLGNHAGKVRKSHATTIQNKWKEEGESEELRSSRPQEDRRGGGRKGDALLAMNLLFLAPKRPSIVMRVKSIVYFWRLLR
jgi:hypothetical protein